MSDQDSFCLEEAPLPAPASGQAPEPQAEAAPPSSPGDSASVYNSWWHRAFHVARLKTIALTMTIGASMGFAAFSVFIRDQLVVFVAANSLPWKVRIKFAVAMAASVSLALVVAFAHWCKTRRQRPRATHLAVRRLAPLAVAGFLPTLLEVRVWQGNELTILILICVFSFVLYRAICASQDAGAVVIQSRLSPRRTEAWYTRLVPALQRHKNVPLILVLAGVAAYTLYFSFHTLQTHYRFGTASFDLGLEDNLVWNAARGGPLFKMAPLGGPDSTHAGYHQTYFAYVIALVYRFFPGPQTLLVVQAFLMGAAAIPLFFLARKPLGSWTGCLIGWLYLLYPPLHGAALYDFHYLPLGTVFLWSALAFIQSGRPLLCMVAVVAAASVREDVNAMTAMLGVILVVEGKHVRAGLLLTCVGALTFGVLKFVVMPRYLDGSQSFLHQYVDLMPEGGTGYPAVLLTIFSNPAYTLKTLLERDKLLYILQIFGPLAFFPLRRWIGVLGCVVGIFFTLLSTRYAPQIQISFQYTTYWTTFLFVFLIRNLEWTRQSLDTDVLKRSRAWLAVVVSALLVSSLQYGAVLNTTNTRGGFGEYRFGLLPGDHERHRLVYNLLALLPRKAKVVASEMLVPHVSSRKNAYTLRTGVYDAAYALFELPLWAEEGDQLRPLIESGEFGVVDVQGSYVLAKRGHSTRRNQEILKRM